MISSTSSYIIPHYSFKFELIEETRSHNYNAPVLNFQIKFRTPTVGFCAFFLLNFVLSRSLPTKWHSHSKDYSTYMILDPRILMSQFSDFKSNFTFSQTNRHPHDKAKNTQNHTAVCICRHRLDTQTKTLFPF